MIQYQIENHLDVEEFKDILIRSTLAQRRPEDLETLTAMLQHANLIVTARIDKKLIGVSRSLTDFQYCTYLSDLAVDVAYQKQGVGKTLIKETKLRTPHAKLILLAAPDAIPYYPKIGFEQYEFCYFLKDAKDLK